MLERTAHNYVLARVHARQGARAGPKTWVRLAAYRDFRGYLGALVATPLAGCVSGLDPDADVHAVEQHLRSVWRGYIEEVAGWHGGALRNALLLLAELPEIPRVAYLSQGEPCHLWVAPLDPRSDIPNEIDVWRERFLATLSRPYLAGEIGAEFAGLLKPRHPFPEAVDLRAFCERLFRRSRLPFVAVLAHLGCVASDLIELRGELAVRLVLPNHTAEA